MIPTHDKFLSCIIKLSAKVQNTPLKFVVLLILGVHVCWDRGLLEKYGMRWVACGRGLGR
jgi:hypothetical protein